MGRHTAPGTGTPAPDTGFWVRLGTALVVVALLLTYVLLRGGDDTQTTTRPGGQQMSAPAPSPAASTRAPASESGSPASTTASPSPRPATRPPTLRFEVRRATYITVRVPGGRTLVSRLFTKGQRRSFDQKVLQVVNGRPSAVDMYVNGKLRKPGPPTQVDVFTVRRR